VPVSVSLLVWSRQCCIDSASQALSDDQSTWVKQTNERVLKILRETPPDGEIFTDTVMVGHHAAGWFSRSLLLTEIVELIKPGTH